MDWPLNLPLLAMDYFFTSVLLRNLASCLFSHSSKLKCHHFVALQFLDGQNIEDPAPETGQSRDGRGIKLQLQPIVLLDGSLQPRPPDTSGQSALRRVQTDQKREAEPHISTTAHHKSLCRSEPSSQSEPLEDHLRLSLPGSPITGLDGCLVAPPHSSESGS